MRWIEGEYLTIRPSFGDPGALYAYRTEIFWDEAGRGSAFARASGSTPPSRSTGGVGAEPVRARLSGHQQSGQYRLIIVARPTIDGEMHGILSTLLAGRGAQLTPIAAPIVFVPIGKAAEPVFGRIGVGHPRYEAYRELLRRTIDDAFAIFRQP